MSQQQVNGKEADIDLLHQRQFAHKLADMLLQQHTLNSHIIGDWWKENLDWRRAIAQECAELSDSIGWKWWTEQKEDVVNCKVECVDILHFGLSRIAETVLIELDGVEPGEEDVLLEAFLDIGTNFYRAWYYDVDTSETTVWDYIDAITIDALASDRFNVTAFKQLCDCFDMDFEMLHNLYFGKSILNEFRKESGYDRGLYQKYWGGKEDNEHMMDLLKSGVPLDKLKAELYKLMSQWAKYRFPAS